MTSAIALVCCCFTLALTACREAPEQGTSQPLNGPNYYAATSSVCGLTRRSDLEAATGYAYQPGSDLNTPALAVPGMKKCVFPSKSPEGNGASINVATATSEVAVGITYGLANESFTKYREKMQRDLQSLGETSRLLGRDVEALEIRSVDKVGERAFWVPQASELVVLTDRKVLGVYISGQDPEVFRKETARRIALRMIDRLHRQGEKGPGV